MKTLISSILSILFLVFCAPSSACDRTKRSKTKPVVQTVSACLSCSAPAPVSSVVTYAPSSAPVALAPSPSPVVIKTDRPVEPVRSAPILGGFCPNGRCPLQQ